RFADGIARLPTLRLRASTTFLASVDMELTRQRIRESQFDVCLACDPNSVSLTIDSGQQIQRISTLTRCISRPGLRASTMSWKAVRLFPFSCIRSSSADERCLAVFTKFPFFPAGAAY